MLMYIFAWSNIYLLWSTNLWYLPPVFDIFIIGWNVKGKCEMHVSCVSELLRCTSFGKWYNIMILLDIVRWHFHSGAWCLSNSYAMLSVFSQVAGGLQTWKRARDVLLGVQCPFVWYEGYRLDQWFNITVCNIHSNKGCINFISNHPFRCSPSILKISKETN